MIDNLSRSEIIKITKIYNNKVTIPAEIRRRLNLNDGDKIYWAITEKGEILIKKIIPIKNTISDISDY